MDSARVVDPVPVTLELVLAQDPREGLAGDFPGPQQIWAVTRRRVVVAVTSGAGAGSLLLDEAPRQTEPDPFKLGHDRPAPGLGLSIGHLHRSIPHQMADS